MMRWDERTLIIVDNSVKIKWLYPESWLFIPLLISHGHESITFTDR